MRVRFEKKIIVQIFLCSRICITLSSFSTPENYPLLVDAPLVGRMYMGIRFNNGVE